MPAVHFDAAADRKPISDWVVMNWQPLNEFDLTRDIRIAAAAGEFFMLAAGGDQLFLGADQRRVVELAGLAHVGEQIVAAEMDDVDAIDRRNGLDVFQAFHGLDHAAQQTTVVELRHAGRQRHRAIVKMRIAAGDRALADRRELADLDRLARLRRIVHVRIDNAHDAIVEQQRHVRIVDAAYPHQRRNAAGQRRAGDVADGLEIEQRMLAIDENEVVAGRLGDAGDVAGTAQPHRHAERDATGAHALQNRVHDSIRGHQLTPKLFLIFA